MRITAEIQMMMLMDPGATREIHSFLGIIALFLVVSTLRDWCLVKYFKYTTFHLKVANNIGGLAFIPNCNYSLNCHSSNMTGLEISPQSPTPVLPVRLLNIAELSAKFPAH